MLYTKFFSILVSFTLVAVLSTQKLTRAENNLRKETCGKGLKLKKSYGRKVLNGVKSRITDAPWNVAIEVLNEKESGLCTGTLISTRHVITARHCFAFLTDDGYVSSANEEKIEGCQNEEEKDVVMTGNFSNSFRLYAGVGCGYRKHCPGSSFSLMEISKIILPKICDDKQLDFDDFAIVELSESLNFSERIRAICVAEDHVLEIGNDVQMRLYGYGLDPSSGNNSAGILKYETVKAERCFKTTKKAFCTRSISQKQLACVGDSGGGVVRMVNDRVTVVGVIYQGVTCESSTTNELDYVASVAYYSADICEYTGICADDGVNLKKNTQLSTNQTSASRQYLSMMILMFLVLVE